MLARVNKNYKYNGMYNNINNKPCFMKLVLSFSGKKNKQFCKLIIVIQRSQLKIVIVIINVEESFFLFSLLCLDYPPTIMNKLREYIVLIVSSWELPFLSPNKATIKLIDNRNIIFCN